ncbi:hypothetical protein L6452_29456 [Arctium lappa]|uniref:Uncharacterized protein n=1 Tax=Arctium lappa TaxID=4217 RepID=A0ACB8ZL44_ARCLA|nr:hypothetical protein L6452_29456 [Arctium lappa]
MITCFIRWPSNKLKRKYLSPTLASRTTTELFSHRPPPSVVRTLTFRPPSKHQSPAGLQYMTNGRFSISRSAQCLLLPFNFPMEISESMGFM